MKNLSMNINVMRASTILGMVSDATTIDDYILLEDDQFGTLLHKYAHNGDINKSVQILIEYVNNNYWSS